MKSLPLAVLCAAVLHAAPAFAGAQVLGFEIGATTVDQVRAKLDVGTPTKDLPINKYSKGPMIETRGETNQIEGLSDVLYIFDPKGLLCAVVLTIDKSRVDFVLRSLAAKYKLVRSIRPFVGDQYALFTAPDTTIEVDAPHMSFEMEVRYFRPDFLKAYKSQSHAEEAAKRRREGSQF